MRVCLILAAVLALPGLARPAVAELSSRQIAVAFLEKSRGYHPEHGERMLFDRQLYQGNGKLARAFDHGPLQRLWRQLRRKPIVALHANYDIAIVGPGKIVRRLATVIDGPAARDIDGCYSLPTAEANRQQTAREAVYSRYRGLRGLVRRVLTGALTIKDANQALRLWHFPLLGTHRDVIAIERDHYGKDQHRIAVNGGLPELFAFDGR